MYLAAWESTDQYLQMPDYPVTKSLVLILYL